MPRSELIKRTSDQLPFDGTFGALFPIVENELIEKQRIHPLCTTRNLSVPERMRVDESNERTEEPARAPSHRSLVSLLCLERERGAIHKAGLGPIIFGRRVSPIVR